MYLQSIKSFKHYVVKSVDRSIFKKSRHIGFGVFIVHSSMALNLAQWKDNKNEKTEEFHRFISTSAKFGTCIVLVQNMAIECAHFGFARCRI
jgi:hypothetical protein